MTHVVVKMASKRSHEESENSNPNTPSGSDVSTSKKARKGQRFREHHMIAYPVLKPSSVGDTYAFCTVCDSNFSVSHGGINDCAMHVNGPRHKKYAESKKNQPTLLSFTKKDEHSNISHSNMKAELLFTAFLVEHNVPISAADHASKLFRAMFPDSDIAKGFQCARTKASALIKHQAQQASCNISESARSVFSLSTDGSNDNSDKFYPIVLRHLSDTGVKVSLLSVPTVTESSATGENIFNTINSELHKHDLRWENCLALGGDNAPVMSGQKKGLFGYAKRQQPNMYFAGCPCHLMHIAAKNGAKELPLGVEEILTDIYYYLKYSSKRQTVFKEIQELYDTDTLKVLKYAPTRWLSMGNCLTRILKLWGPLRDFFTKECDNLKSTDSTQNDRPRRVLKFLQSHTAKAICYFLAYALEIFDSTNMALQAEKPLIQKTRRIQHGLYRKLLTKFVKPAAFTGKALTDVNTSVSHNMKSDADISIGEKTRTYMAEKKMPSEKCKRITESARAFYKTAAKYLLTKLPMTDVLQQHAEVFDPARLSSMSFTSVRYFTDRFPVLKPPCTMDALEEQFLGLQVEEMSTTVLQEDRADQQWLLIGRIKDEATGLPKYPDLAHVAQCVLLIPHSNACCERVFSAVRKYRTDFRSSMAADTLEALCTLKMQGRVCHEVQFTKEETKLAKSATVKILTK